MTFTSHAQNFEDVMLWRALKHIDRGCYVDVGAQHPVIDSVSKAFYEQGWRGIHIEPVPQYAELLRRDRPDETVLQVALSDTEGTLELNVIPGTGLSTAVDAYAQRHQEERMFERQQVSVPAMTLKTALQPLAGKQVHWLKIDVEGFETQVLKGWDSQALRPWVMVVEATIPGSSETDYTAWDSMIVAANYRFVYFDGLNRFYVAQEHAELAAAFLSPPNTFDDFKLTGDSSFCSELVAAYRKRELELAERTNKHIAHYEAHAAQAEARTAQAEAQAAQAETRTAQAETRTAQAETRTAQAEAQAAQAEMRTAQAEAQAAQAEMRTAQAEAQAAQIEAQLCSILNSRSWRITAPLRFIAGLSRRIKAALREGRLLSGINRRIKSTRRQPGAAVQNPRNLPPRAARIYAELKKTVELENTKRGHGES